MLKAITVAVLLIASASHAEGLSAWSRTGGRWQPLGFLCETRRRIYFAAERPGADPLLLEEIDKSDPAGVAEHVLREPEFSGDAESSDYRYVGGSGEFVLGSQWSPSRESWVERRPVGAGALESCRLPERTVLACVTDRRTLFLSEREGRWSYASFDFANPRLDAHGEVQAEVESGAELRISFDRPGVRYRLTASADPGRPGAEVEVLRQGRVIKQERCRIYAVDPERIRAHTAEARR